MGQLIVDLDNMMMVEQYKVESGVIPAGKYQIVIAPPTRQEEADVQWRGDCYGRRPGSGKK